MAERIYWGGVSDGLMAYLLRPRTPMVGAADGVLGVRHALKSPSGLVQPPAARRPRRFARRPKGYIVLGFRRGGVRALGLSFGSR
jgi:hypothetical protein